MCLWKIPITSLESITATSTQSSESVRTLRAASVHLPDTGKKKNRPLKTCMNLARDKSAFESRGLS